MKADKKTVYVCSQCGRKFMKWMGQCSYCGAWNTLEETQEMTVTKTSKSSTVSTIKNLTASKISDIDHNNEVRFFTGLKELDRVLGGGVVKGSLVLLAGEPGAGKSTLLLQISQHLAAERTVLYVSGEESAKQIKLRAGRIGVNSDNIQIMSAVDVLAICDYIQANQPQVVIIDSIQTMMLETINSGAGSVSQVRECTNCLLKCAKENDIPIFIVGHVNKDGNIAGPKVLEHRVDAVLYFEGDKQYSYRCLRSAKNRYGSTNEIGVFDMTGKGLVEVENPSQMFLEGRPENASGTCVTCNIEGSRPILNEVQCLLTKTSFAAPRRVATGYDYNRAYLLIAVMEKKGGFYCGNMDVYINIVGGMRLDEPGADLSVLLAMYSSIKDMPLPDDLLAIGEVGLAGEIRAVSQLQNRVNEAARLGFKYCLVPMQNLRHANIQANGIQVIGVQNIKQAFAAATKLAQKQP